MRNMYTIVWEYPATLCNKLEILISFSGKLWPHKLHVHASWLAEHTDEAIRQEGQWGVRPMQGADQLQYY